MSGIDFTRQQLVVIQRASERSHAGAVVRNVPLLQCIGDLTVGFDPAQIRQLMVMHMKHKESCTQVSTGALEFLSPCSFLGFLFTA